MTALPVIARELRTQARARVTYLQRVCAALGLLLVLSIFALNGRLLPGWGKAIFATLHTSIILGIWIFVPMMAADSVSRERREGTLGLLFLTPLRARDIIVAKGLAHALKVLTLGASLLPIMAIPALIGGVTWHDGAALLVLSLCSMLVALSAGILASCYSKSWSQAILLSAGLTMGLAYCLFLGAGMVALAFSPAGTGGWTVWGWAGNWGGQSWTFSQLVVTGQFAELASASSKYGLYLFVQPYSVMLASAGPGIAAPGGLPTLGLPAAAGALVVAAAICLATLRVAGWGLQRNWQDRPATRRQLWFQREFATPKFGKEFLGAYLKRRLERNPVGWLELRTWSGRLVVWSWLAVMTCMITFVAGGGVGGRAFDPDGLQVLGWLLLASMTVNVAGSFRRERETGVMELLLVSPLGIGQLMHGRMRAIYGQFLISMVLLVLCWVWLFAAWNPWQSRYQSSSSLFSPMISVISSFVLLPIAGLYLSLMCRNFLSALLLILLVVLVMPPVLASLVARWWIFWAGGWMTAVSAPMIWVWVISGVLLLAIAGLYLSLRYRNIRSALLLTLLAVLFLPPVVASLLRLWWGHGWMAVWGPEEIEQASFLFKLVLRVAIGIAAYLALANNLENRSFALQV